MRRCSGQTQLNRDLFLLETVTFKLKAESPTESADGDWPSAFLSLWSRILSLGGSVILVKLLGSTRFKIWSSTRATVTLSSAEAKLYASVKGASQMLGMIALAHDMGHDLNGQVKSDASASTRTSTSTNTSQCPCPY